MFSFTQPVSLGYLPPIGKPGCKIPPHLGRIAPVVHPAQLQQAIFIDPARHIIERISEEVHIAALPEDADQHFGNRFLQPR